MKQIIQHLKALSEPGRLRLVALLKQGELCVCQLEVALKLSQANVSRHLAILRQAGVVTDRREGRWVYYSLTEPVSADLRDVQTALVRALDDDATIKTDRIRAEAVRCILPSEVAALTIQPASRNPA